MKSVFEFLTAHQQDSASCVHKITIVNPFSNQIAFKMFMEISSHCVYSLFLSLKMQIKKIDILSHIINPFRTDRFFLLRRGII